MVRISTTCRPPTFGHSAETFLVAYPSPRCPPPTPRRSVRQMLTALGTRQAVAPSPRSGAPNVGVAWQSSALAPTFGAPAYRIASHGGSRLCPGLLRLRHVSVGCGNV